MATESYQLDVDGMSCEHCRCRVQRALEAVPGVTSVDVNLATGTATVEADPDSTSLEELAASVEEVGYTVSTTSQS